MHFADRPSPPSDYSTILARRPTLFGQIHRSRPDFIQPASSSLSTHIVTMSLRLLTSSLRPFSRPVLARPTALPQPFLSASRLYSTPAAEAVDEAAKKLKDELKTALKTAMKARDGEKTGIVKVRPSAGHCSSPSSCPSPVMGLGGQVSKSSQPCFVHRLSQ